MPRPNNAVIREPKRMGSYLLTDEAIDAVHREARKRRCWPNRVVEDLIRQHLDTSEDVPAKSA